MDIRKIIELSIVESLLILFWKGKIGFSFWITIVKTLCLLDFINLRVTHGPSRPFITKLSKIIGEKGIHCFTLYSC
jgi:hypothetical protein